MRNITIKPTPAAVVAAPSKEITYETRTLSSQGGNLSNVRDMDKIIGIIIKGQLNQISGSKGQMMTTVMIDNLTDRPNFTLSYTGDKLGGGNMHQTVNGVLIFNETNSYILVNNFRGSRIDYGTTVVENTSAEGGSFQSLTIIRSE